MHETGRSSEQPSERCWLGTARVVLACCRIVRSHARAMLYRASQRAALLLLLHSRMSLRARKWSGVLVFTRSLTCPHGLTWYL